MVCTQFLNIVQVFIHLTQCNSVQFSQVVFITVQTIKSPYLSALIHLSHMLFSIQYILLSNW